MSGLGESLGVGNASSGAQGSPSGIINAASKEQADQTYGEAQDALAQQQSLAQALQGQGTQGMGYQTQLGQALLAQSQGQGPNPAQTQLAQNTAANTANQAALMAGQRGAGGNVGLIARQVGQQGAATQQQSVGQAATLQAQQQLAAQQQLQNLAGTQVNQNQTATSNYNQAAQGEQANVLNAIAAQNNANVGLQSNINNANSAMAQLNANNAAKFTGGVLNSVGQLFGGPAQGSNFAHGGIVKENPKLAQVPQQDRFEMPDHIKGMAQIYYPDYAAKMAYGGVAAPSLGGIDVGSPIAHLNTSLLGNKAKSPMQKIEKPLKKAEGEDTGGEEWGGEAEGAEGAGAEEAGGAEAAGEAGEGGEAAEAGEGLEAAALLSKGGVIPGKPKVNHNTEKNDVVPALLTPKEIVLPISVTQAKDAPEAAKQFVMALLAKQGDKSSSHEDDFRKALKDEIAKRKKK